MCGIAGFFSTTKPLSAPEAGTRFAKAAKVLHHRGPDATKHWVDEQGRAGLLHVRLSIIDLTTGDQPLGSCDPNLKLVHNGEFYDFERQRAELEKAGHRFKTKSDSEVALHLYEDCGADAVARLRGEFAFLLWDGRQERMLAVRDRFGIKPLFYAEHDGRLFFASEMKALFAMGVPAEWDPETVGQFHAGLLMHPSRTLFRNVFQVPPGHLLLASRGQRLVRQYWDFNYPKAAEKKAVPLPEAIERTREKLVEAVRLRLRADVKVGCYLSGGLDSCTALGIASALSKEPVAAFTLTFDDPLYDEGAIAKEMAEKTGAEYRPVPMLSEDLATHFAEGVWHAETPFVNTHGIAKFLLSREVNRAGYKVVLTGEGSDEIFAGYPHFRRDWLFYQSGNSDADVQRAMKELEAKNEVSRAMLLGPSDSSRLQPVRKRLGHVPSFFENWAMLGESLGDYLRPEWKSGREPYAFYLDEFDVPRQLTGREPVDQSLYLWSKMMLPNYLLSVLGDRMEMAHSVEGRLPFLDHEFVEMVVQMPVEYKIRGMTEKYLLREAAKPYLTDTVYRRQKHPFLAPPAASREEDAVLDLAEQTLRDATAIAPFYEPAQFKKLLDELPTRSSQDRGSADPLLMIATSFSWMHQRFVRAS